MHPGWKALLGQESELRERLARMREMRVTAAEQFPELVPTLDEAMVALEQVVGAIGRARAGERTDAAD